MDAMRQAFESGDRSARREHGPVVERQWKELSAKDEEFDQDLKNILTKDQLERYREELEKRQQRHWRGDRRPPRDAGSDRYQDRTP